MANVLHLNRLESHQNTHRWGGLANSAKALACAE